MSKSFKIISGIKLNIGRKSISTTIGKRGLSINTGSKGTFINIGLPGTGIRHRRKLFKTNSKAIRRTKLFHHTHSHEDNVITGTVMLGFIIGGAIFLISGSFLWSIVPVFLVPILCSFADNHNHYK